MVLAHGVSLPLAEVGHHFFHEMPASRLFSCFCSVTLVNFCLAMVHVSAREGVELALRNRRSWSVSKW